MPKRINVKNKYTVATHDFSDKRHYVLKSMIDPTWHHLLNAKAESLCGLVKVGRARKVLVVTQTASMSAHDITTCQSCFRAFAKLEEVQVAAKKPKQGTKTKKKQFIDDVERILFTYEGVIDKDKKEQFESDIANAIANNLEFGDITLKEFLGFFHEMLRKHGAKIRNMLILYQRIYGTLVPCRNTMEKMKDAGIYV